MDNIKLPLLSKRAIHAMSNEDLKYLEEESKSLAID